jgi:hypothetical protein
MKKKTSENIDEFSPLDNNKIYYVLGGVLLLSVFALF